MFKFGCLALVILLIGIPAVSAKYLPLWGVLLVVAAEAALLVIGGPKLIGYVFKRFAMGMISMKSKVLSGAGVHVHRVEKTEKPVRQENSAVDALPDQSDEGNEDENDVEEDDEEESDEDDEPDRTDYHYVLVEFTLTPRPNMSKMESYEPSELMLIPFDKVVKFDEDSNDNRSASVEQIRQIDDSGAEAGDFDKLTGRSRLRAVFACPPTLRGRVKFQYYFESFGDLLLP